MNSKPINRRDFLRLAGMVGGSAFLAACGKTLSTPMPSATQAAGGAPVTKPAKISFMGWGAIEEDEAVRAAIEAFKEVEPNIEVSWMHTPDSYNEKLLSLVAAKTPPDTAFISAGDFRTFANEGLLVDITDMIKNDPVIGAKGYFFEPQEEQRCTWDGRWYGIGSCWVANQLTYNADVFEEAGIEPPSTDPEKIWDWETFKDIARQLTIDKNGRHLTMLVSTLITSNASGAMFPITGCIMPRSSPPTEATTLTPRPGYSGSILLKQSGSCRKWLICA